MAEERGVGDLLRAARERQGWSLADVAAATKIPRHHLEALENGDWSALPPRVYALGFLKIYARHLGLDPAPLVTRLDAVAPPPEQRPEAAPLPAAPPPRRPAPPSPAPRATRRPTRGSGAWVTTAVALLVVFGGLLYILHTPPGHPTAASLTTHAHRRTHPSHRGRQGSRHHRSRTGPSTGPSTPPPPTLLTSSTSQLTYAVSKGPVVLQLTASSPCWMEEWFNGVNQGTGGTTIAAGQTVTLTESQSVQVYLGNPRVVTVTVDGHAEGQASQGTIGDPRYILAEVQPAGG